MSIRLMSEAWDMDIPATEKMVLLCLCDHANDDGECWPSMARVARKCSVSDRTVQRSIQSLIRRGILTAKNRPGTSSFFHVDPRHSVTPDTVSPPTMTTKPPTQCHPTPDTVSPKPLRTTKEPSSKNIVRKPDDLDSQVWQDWKRVRKKPITPTVMAGVKREADKIGWTVSQAITHAAESSWQGFKADWIKDESNGKPRQASGATDNRDGAMRALDRRLGLDDIAGTSGRRTAGQSHRDSPLRIASPSSG